MQFPKEEGWYLGDSVHDIPTGKKLNSPDEKSRCLERVENRVGPVHRIDIDVGGVRQDVGLNGRPSFSLGVVVETP